MKRKILFFAITQIVSTATFAGGFLTNTNQNVLFLRNPARDAAIAIDGVYSNPAGVSFMHPGWHLSLNVQSAYQTRTIHSRFGGEGMYPFAFGEGNAQSGEKKFKGDAQAPVIPSFQLAYVGKRWTLSASMAVTGGGGKCEFDNGLGLFESQAATLPIVANLLMGGGNNVTGYSLDTRVRGRQYYYGLQAGAGYRFNDHLSAYVGGRLTYADCNYYGYVRNIQLKTPMGYLPAGQLLEQAGLENFAGLVGERKLDCDQTGWGFTPVLGIDYKTGKWNFAAKYEFKTRIRLKNQSFNTSGLAEFDDQKKIPADIPAILALGVQYEFTPALRASVGYHHYFDQKATQFENKNKHLASGENEFLAGVEYDINKRITASAGMQTTNYGLGKNSKYIDNISFNTDSYSIGLGVGIHLTDKINLNVAYFKTIYEEYTKRMDDYNGLKNTFTQQITALEQSGKLTPQEWQAVQTLNAALPQLSTSGYDKFTRTNDVFGIGIDIDF